MKPDTSLNTLKNLAQDAAREKDWPAALSHWNQLLGSFPSHFPAYVGKANAYIALECFEEAETIFNAVTQKFPKHSQGFGGLVRVAFRRQQWQQALRHCNSLLNRFPEHVQGHVWKGKALTHLEQFEQAETIYRKLINQEPPPLKGFQGLAQLLMTTGQWPLALQCWNDCIERFPHELSGYLGKCTVLNQLGKIAEAIALCQKAIQLFPNQSQSYQRLGDIYRFQKNDFTAAQAAYSKGLAVNGSDSMLHIRLASLLSLQGKHSKAIDLLKNAVKIEPNSPKVYQALARTLRETGDIQAAQTTLQQAIQAQPQNPEAYKNLAHFQAIHLKDFSNAWKNLEMAQTLDNTYLPAFEEQANLLLRVGLIQESRQCFQTISQQFEHKQNGWIGIARLESQLKNYEQAIIAWDRVIQKFPHKVLLASKEKALCLVLLRYLDEAKSIYQGLCQRFPDSPEGLVGLATVAEHCLDWDTALDIWQQIIQQFPSYIDAYFHRSNIFIQQGNFRAAGLILEPICKTFSVAHLWCSRLHLKNQQLGKALDHAKQAAQKEFTVRAHSQILLIALRLGSIEDVENVIDVFWERKLRLCSENIFELLQNARRRLGVGDFTSAWKTYLSIFNREYGQYKSLFKSALGANPITFIIFVLEFVSIIVAHSKTKWFDIVIEHLYQNQDEFECQPDLIAYCHLLLSLKIKETRNYKLALASAKYSISINPDSRSCLMLIEYLQQTQFSQPHLKPVNGNIQSAIMIISCRKNIDKINILEQNFYKHSDIPYYFVIGNPNLENDWVLEDKILYVKTLDNYESLSAKVLKALEFFYHFSVYQGILKLDDDCWIRNIDALKSSIHQLETNNSADYFGNINNVTIGRTWHFSKCETLALNKEPYGLENHSRFCAGGSGYYLSRKSLRTLVNHVCKYPNSLFKELYEDVLIGKLLSLYNIKPCQFNLIGLGIIETNCDVRIQCLSLNSLYQDAERAAQSGSLQEAINLYKKIIELDQENRLRAYQTLIRLLYQFECSTDASKLENEISASFPTALLNMSVE